MQIKLIASDLDDTLLNEERKISQRNEAAIQKAVQAGIVVTLASGRMFCSMKPYAEQLQLDVPLVSYNGALVKGAFSNQIYTSNPMKLETALDLLAYSKEKQYYIQVYIDDKLYVKEENAFSDKYSRISGIKPIALGEDIYSIKEAPNKLLLMTKGVDFTAAWKDVEERFCGRVDVTSSKDNFLELMEPGINKWEALCNLAEQFDIKPEEIMCIGDSNNDLSMIRNAGLGVAVANAKLQVQQAAKMVTASNNNDGVALAIEHVLAKQVIPES